MKTCQDNTGRFIVSLARGETLRASIEEFAKANQIFAAKISAIGALEETELGCYDLQTKTYDRRTFGGIYELLSLDGNISRLNDAPFMHVHAAISGHDYQVYGGHLFDAKVGVVVEMFIEPTTAPLPRIMCADIGLPRWEPGES